MDTPRRILAAFFVTVAFNAPPAAANTQPPTPAAPPSPPAAAKPAAFSPVVPVTRIDLAHAYLNFDERFTKAALTPAQAAEASKTFDAVTQQFFMGQFAGAIRRLHELNDTFPGAPKPSDADRLLRSLKLTVEPHVLTRDANTPLKLRLTSIYAPPAPIPADARLHVLVSAVDRAYAVNGFASLSATDTGGIDACVSIPHADAWPGGPMTALVQISLDGKSWIHAGTCAFAIEPMAKAAAAFTARLDSAAKSHAALARAISIARSRIDLLTDDRSTDNTTKALLNQTDHAAALEADVSAIEHGRDPYAQRAGDWWCAMPVANAAIPMRIYAPVGALASKTPPAIVIAFHGFGGDEHMFPDALGHGLIKSLADKHNFILVSPATTAFARNDKRFDEFVAFIKSLYTFDGTRIYLLGHSMGAGWANELASRRVLSVAASACIAGGPLTAFSRSRAPILVIAGELDPIIPPAGLKRAAAANKDNGYDIDYREIAGAGHTTLVAAALPGAVEWLLNQRLDVEARKKRIAADAERANRPEQPPADPKLNPPPGATPSPMPPK